METLFATAVSLLLLHSMCVVYSAQFNIDGSQTLTINGKANVKLDPAESMWASLARSGRFPIINSGDLIALRRATTSGTSYWLRCYKNKAACYMSSCPGKNVNVMLKSKWSSCPELVFKIRAMGKLDGQPVNSGDFVILTFPYHRHSASGYEYYFRCTSSTSWQCRADWAWKPLYGNYWFDYTFASFRIFSREAVDGTPIQLGDTVGLKYPYNTADSWLYYYGGYFYPRSCSRNHKWNCAKANHPAGFQIFKKL